MPSGDCKLNIYQDTSGEKGRKGRVHENDKTMLASVLTAGVSTPEFIFGGTDTKQVSKRVSQEVNAIS